MYVALPWPFVWRGKRKRYVLDFGSQICVGEEKKIGNDEC